MLVTTKKSSFLQTENKNNQLRLSELLRKINCMTHHAFGDADTLVAQKALESAITAKTVLVGADTDILILLCYHVDLELHDLFLSPEPETTTKKPHLVSSLTR